MIISRSNNCPYCGDGHENSCYITYHDGDYCFSCGHGIRKGADYYSYRLYDEIPVTSELFIPECTFKPNEFSLNVLEWLYKYYISDDDIKLHRIAYCVPQAGKSESLLLPILGKDDKEILAYQRRFFPDKTFYSSIGLRDQLFIPGYRPDSHTVVLVEDYISALRVSKVLPSLCIFGTKPNNTQIDFIINHFNKVVIWLDNDEPGQKAAYQLRTKLYHEYQLYLGNRAYITNTVTISTIENEKQPKENSRNEIRKILST